MILHFLRWNPWRHALHTTSCPSPALTVLCCALAALALTGAGTKAKASVIVPLTDANIRYIGRWDRSNPGEYHSYWSGAYIRVGFTGTSVKVNLGGGTALAMSIDGGAIREANASGVFPVNTAPLPAGNHTLLVGSLGQNYEVLLQGLTLDDGASTLPLPPRPLLEFIGDSITAGGSATVTADKNYAWLAAESLDCDHTQIAFSGVALTTGYGSSAVGMDQQYFRLKNFNHLSDNPQAPWNFSYAPGIVVILLGQNEGGEPAASFQNSYVNFIHNIRAKYPYRLTIVAMRTFGGSQAAAASAAVAALKQAGDTDIQYVDTTGWLQSSDFSDGVHPTPAGNIKVANLLAPLLQPFVTNEIRYEAESLAVANTSGITPRLISSPSFSAGLGSILDATAVGDQITYVVPNVTSQTYEVRIGMKNFVTRGIWQLAIGRAVDFAGTARNLGSPQDEYSSGETFLERSLGLWTPSLSSDKWFRFTITGKNASSQGYTEAFDYITLVPQ